MPMRQPKGAAATTSSGPPPTLLSPPRATSASKQRSTTPVRPSSTTSTKPPSSPTTKPSAAAVGGSQQQQAQRKPSSAAAPSSPQSQSVRDRIVALYAKYDPPNIPRTQQLMKKFAGDKAMAEDFIRQYVEKHGPEPPSKEHALREHLSKTYKGDQNAIESAMGLIRDVPGMDIEIFNQLEIQEKQQQQQQQQAAASSPRGASPSKQAPSKQMSVKTGGGGAASPSERPVSPSRFPPAKTAPAPTASNNNNNTTTAGGLAPGGNINAASKFPPSKTAPGPGSPTKQQPVNKLQLGAGGGSPNYSSAPASKRPMTMQQQNLMREQSDPFASANRRGSNTEGGSTYQGPTGVHTEAEVQTVMREKSTCDKNVRDRVIAMLACYDPDSFLVFDEDADIPNTQVGNSFLNALMETHGPEPASKSEAIEKLLRRLLEKQDPARLKSVKTLLAAAESSGKEAQIVRALFNAYGLGHRAGKSAASSGLAAANYSDMAGSASSPYSAGSRTPLMSIRGGPIIDNSSSLPTSTSILSPFFQVGGTAGWTPDSSMKNQRNVFDSSPRRMPLRTKEDLLSQLSGSPKVHKTNPNGRSPSFSDLLTLDTDHGPESLVSSHQQQGGDMHESLTDLTPFKKTAAGEAHDASAEEFSEVRMDGGNATNNDNPFLRAGAQPRKVQSKQQSAGGVIPEFPKTPPSVDLGGFGTL